MTPGLTKWDPEIRSGEIVAITLQDGIPVAVGIAAFDIGRLSKAAGEKGKAVYLVHCYRDELWAIGSKTNPPKSTPAITDTELETATQELSLNSRDEDQHVSNVEYIEDAGETLPKPNVEANQVTRLEPSTSGSLFEVLADVDIDNAFKAAAIYGLYQIKVSESQNSLSLPMPSSTLVSNHLNPYLVEPFAQMTFKKTSWKKAATFLKKYLEKEGIVKTKDRGGETVIISINWNHKFITEFEPYDLGHHGLAKSLNSDSESSRGMVQVHELYKPSGKAFKAILDTISKPYSFMKIMSKLPERMICILHLKSASFSVSTSLAMQSWLTPETLGLPFTSPSLRSSFIKVDYNLAPLLKPEEGDLVSLPRDKLLERLLDSASSYYTITTETEAQTRYFIPTTKFIVERGNLQRST